MLLPCLRGSSPQALLLQGKVCSATVPPGAAEGPGASPLPSPSDPAAPLSHVFLTADSFPLCLERGRWGTGQPRPLLTGVRTAPGADGGTPRPARVPPRERPACSTAGLEEPCAGTGDRQELPRGQDRLHHGTRHCPVLTPGKKCCHDCTPINMGNGYCLSSQTEEKAFKHSNICLNCSYH